MRIDPVIQCQTDDDSRDAGNNDLEPHLPDVAFDVGAKAIGFQGMGIVFLSEGEQFREVQHDDRHDGAELNDHLEHFLEFLRDIELEKFVYEDHVTGTADRQPFRDTFHDTKDDGFQKFQKIHRESFLYVLLCC